MRAKSVALGALLLVLLLALVGGGVLVVRDLVPSDTADVEAGIDHTGAAGEQRDESAGPASRTRRPRVRLRDPGAAGEDESVPTGEARGVVPADTKSRLPTRAPGRVGGLVLGPDGTAIPGATVSIWRARQPGEMGGPQDARELPTGDGGVFVVDGLESWEYVAEISAPGLVSTRVRVKPGAEPVTVSLTSNRAIAGIVKRATDGVGASDLPVVLFEGGSRVIGTGIRQTSTDAEGRFRLDRVPEGRFVVHVGSGLVHNATKPDLYREVRIPDVAAGTTDLEITVHEGLRISGTIVDELSAPVLAPVDIWLASIGPNGERDHGENRQLWRAEGGKFVYGGLPPGAYDLTFRLSPTFPRQSDVKDGEGDAEGSVDDASFAGVATLSGVAAGTEGLVVRMVRAAPIAGRLIDDAGEAVKGLGWVNAFPAGGNPGTPGAVHVYVTSGDGRFELAGLDAGRTYDMIAGGFEGHRTARAYGIVPGASHVEIVLERAPRITGRVLDHEGRPVPPGISVRAEAMGDVPSDAPGRSAEALTQYDGGFALEGLGEFEYRIAAGGGSSKYAPAATLANVAAGKTDVELRVKVGCELRGRLLDANGDPLRADVLSVRPVGGVQSRSRTRAESEDGAFVVRGLVPGRVDVGAYIDGSWIWLGEHTAPATDLELRVPAPDTDPTPK